MWRQGGGVGVMRIHSCAAGDPPCGLLERTDVFSTRLFQGRTGLELRHRGAESFIRNMTSFEGSLVFASQ